MKAYIKPEKCLHCKKCKAATNCRIDAIFQIDSQDPAIVEVATCHGCGDCIENCPNRAVILVEG